MNAKVLATNSAAARHVKVGDVNVAYRELGGGAGAPLVLLQRFRGTMDHWDPALLDALALKRPIILFDSPGVGRSEGVAADSIAGMAVAAANVLGALGVVQADLLGWSMGGTVTLQLCLNRPDLVRRAVVAGSSPGGVPNAPKAPDKVWQVAGKSVNDDEDFLYLFFHDTAASQAAGRAHLQRLQGRGESFSPAVTAETMKAQFTAIGAWAAGRGSALPRLGEIAQPVFVANGQADRMVPAYNSFVLAQGLPDAKLVLYPDSGHGFLFQHAAEFARDVSAFLSA
jgi:pimeloyl-ACP methyl ester carboxylesterase